MGVWVWVSLQNKFICSKPKPIQRFKQKKIKNEVKKTLAKVFQCRPVGKRKEPTIILESLTYKLWKIINKMPLTI
jgi:hypothetical protein